MAALLLVLGALIGVGLGWYLRRINTWCPHCGDVMVCRGCSKTAVGRPDRARGAVG